MKKPDKHISANIKLAETTWGPLDQPALDSLRELLKSYRLSVTRGDLLYLDGRWYVTNAGLLRLAERRHCTGIRVQEVREFCDPAARRWVFKATLYKRNAPRGFVGYGDADPSNVSALVRGAEMRVAETRAVNRALRKAYGIGLCSVEELGWTSRLPESVVDRGKQNNPHTSNGSNNGQPRLRDRLCLLIRQHKLDPTLVKQYAAEFCGTQSLKETSRDLVESFIVHLADWAKQDRDGLLCKLNSYAQPVEPQS
jgi:hypothetical protein